MNLNVKHECVPSTERKVTITISLQGKELEEWKSFINNHRPPRVVFGLTASPFKSCYVGDSVERMNETIWQHLDGA